MTFSDELDNFLKIFFFLKNFFEFGSQRLEFGKVGIVIFFERALVFRIRRRPIHGRKVFSLRQLLVQSPKHLHDAESGGRDGVREITTWWRYGADDWDWSKPKIFLKMDIFTKFFLQMSNYDIFLNFWKFCQNFDIFIKI